jgi:hypothetical protein
MLRTAGKRCAICGCTPQLRNEAINSREELNREITADGRKRENIYSVGEPR